MAQVFDGSLREFRQVAYGRPSERTIAFIRDQFESPTSSLARASESFRAKVVQMYEASYGDEALEQIDRARRRLSSIWNLDEIRQYSTLEDYQNATPTMQRYLMANPTIRRLFQQGRVEGYSSSYVDIDPGTIGRNHYDWRRVMSGAVEMIDDPESPYEWEATTYYDEVLDNEPDLTHMQKLIIRDNWARQEALLMFGQQDATSPTNSRWG